MSGVWWEVYTWTDSPATRSAATRVGVDIRSVHDIGCDTDAIVVRKPQHTIIRFGRSWFAWQEKWAVMLCVRVEM